MITIIEEVIDARLFDGDDDVKCGVHEIPCDEPAVAVWIINCCLTEWPLCKEHDAFAQHQCEDTSYERVCSSCWRPCNSKLWTRIPL